MGKTHLLKGMVLSNDKIASVSPLLKKILISAAVNTLSRLSLKLKILIVNIIKKTQAITKKFNQRRLNSTSTQYLMNKLILIR